MLMTMPRGTGPWGAGWETSIPWDDGVFSAIKQVRVHVGEVNVIYALEFEYLKKDGNSVLSQIHGATNGSKVELVNLDGEDEFLIGVSRFYEPVEGYIGLEAITSISFHTNKRMHGPYGSVQKGVGCNSYSSNTSPGKVAIVEDHAVAVNIYKYLRGVIVEPVICFEVGLLIWRYG
ncbi:hypothetical protein L1987_53297 [Smallanthus sonchifolius]|uniref:Uncharacterized protein n=1 Tax=Smallanthus sonchifolius TaxID=185202 RepID=A0ACB9EVL7_9ASTR|nr:hypothetical protein L1987_53297 [Smallanthus sonchifolius]